ncbi:uncharacterized protein JCM15063_000355 [Sporobolomyces koalae]|uniref:uncharacterized protein n=1 Tax=Sporobolomyces koalae TaxID=500713 RepID=UPI00317C2936
MTALPSQVELKDLLARQQDLRAQLDAHSDLAAKLDGVITARKQGNGRMQLPVELGPGFTAEGVVNDTSRIILAAGIEDLWLDLPVEQARTFVENRTRIIKKRLGGLEQPISQLKEEYALVAKTLREAFQLPDESESTSS